MTAKTPLPPAPDDLTPRSAALWSTILHDYELSPAELQVLRSALISLDRADEAAEVLRRDGIVAVDRYGSPKCHPAADLEARHRALYARFVQQLGVKLTEVDPHKPGAKTHVARGRR